MVPSAARVSGATGFTWCTSAVPSPVLVMHAPCATGLSSGEDCETMRPTLPHGDVPS